MTKKKPCFVCHQSHDKVARKLWKKLTRKKKELLSSLVLIFFHEWTHQHKSNWRSHIHHHHTIFHPSAWTKWILCRVYTPCHDDNDPLQRRRFYNTYKDPNNNTQVFLTTKFNKKKERFTLEWLDRRAIIQHIYQRTFNTADYEAYVCFKATVNYAQIMSCLICFTMKYNFLGVKLSSV